MMFMSHMSEVTEGMNADRIHSLLFDIQRDANIDESPVETTREMLIIVSQELENE